MIVFLLVQEWVAFSLPLSEKLISKQLSEISEVAFLEEILIAWLAFLRQQETLI